MGICWYCYWGWPKQVRDIYNKYLNLTGISAMHSGRGHIVWEDENFSNDDIECCLNSDYDFSHAYSNPKQDEIIKESLKELLLIPEKIRCCEPENYDEENPENFPPPENLVMIKG